MLLRDAATPEPDYPFARRVALFAGALTAGVIVSTFAIIVCGDREPPRIAVGAIPTITLSGINPAWRPAPADASPLDLDMVKAELEAYAFVAFPEFAVDTARECPRNLLELNRYVPTLHAVDPWGMPYQFTCTAGKPIQLRSAGPDRQFDSADDIWR